MLPWAILVISLPFFWGLIASFYILVLSLNSYSTITFSLLTNQKNQLLALKAAFVLLVLMRGHLNEFCHYS
jgi:hypothetical protein